MPEPSNAFVPQTDRASLYGTLDEYLAALKVRDPGRLPWAPCVRNVENNVALGVGDGLWGTASALGPYDLRFADPVNGEVGFFGAVEETGAVSPFGLRLRVEAGRIAEVETLVVRAADSGFRLGEPAFVRKPVLEEMLSASQRSPRERMISIADGYFDTLQLNDGTLFTQFWEQCNRVENGIQTTNNAQLALLPTAALGCAEQFRRGTYRYDDRLRARRFALVDEERGLVLAAAFIDHCGRLGSYRLADGTAVESPIRRPHTFYLMELFKIKDGRIEQIEAVFITVPYNMPSPLTTPALQRAGV